MKNLLLLHGALGAASQFSVLQKALEDNFSIYKFNFPGHGGAAFAPEFGIPLFVRETLRFLDKNMIEKCAIFGYSMGGYIALQLARMAPERVDKIITLATKFDWTPEVAEKETKMLDPDKIAAKVPAFAQQLAGRHAPNDWKELLRKTAGMMSELGRNNLLDEQALRQIPHPVLVCRGDLDLMISLEETRKAASALPNGKLKIFTDTPHPFEKVDTEKMVKVVKEFLKIN